MDSTTEDIYKPSISKIKGKARVLLFIIMLTAFFRNLGLSIVNIGLPKFIISIWNFNSLWISYWSIFNNSINFSISYRIFF
ncbi:MAG: hypothetical protein ACTSSM_04535 [Promethearchaeota archaeon]